MVACIYSASFSARKIAMGIKRIYFDSAFCLRPKRHGKQFSRKIAIFNNVLFKLSMVGVYMCVRVCMCLCVYMYACVHAFWCVWVCVHVFVCVSICACVYYAFLERLRLDSNGWNLKLKHIMTYKKFDKTGHLTDAKSSFSNKCDKMDKPIYPFYTETYWKFIYEFKNIEMLKVRKWRQC